MNFIKASLYNIFDKYKNDELNNQIESIHKEREEIKNNNVGIYKWV